VDSIAESPASGHPSAIETAGPIPAPTVQEPPLPEFQVVEAESPEAPRPRSAALPEPTESAVLPGPAELPEARAAAGPRALVVEDSITARVFVARLLEQAGFSVRAVSSAAELFAELAADPWALILVDVELPDAQGTDFLQAISHRLEEGSPRTALMALVRDAADVALAREAGLIHTLSKPVDPERLMERLRQLGLAPGGGQ
jgi:CheY-like chemotaxis protein